MFKTSDSQRPVDFWNWTEVTADKPETAHVLAEIDLYLAGVRAIYTWLRYVYQCVGPEGGPLWQKHVGRFTNLRTE